MRAFLLFVLLSFFPWQSFAFSEEEQGQLMETVDFAVSENMLKRAWQEIKRVCDRKQFLFISEKQRYWLERQRDEEAARLAGLHPKMETAIRYAVVTAARARFLWDLGKYIAQNPAIGDPVLAEFMERYPYQATARDMAAKIMSLSVE